MSATEKPVLRGWTQIGGSTKFHYFIGTGNSLCDRYMAFSLDPRQIEDTDHDHKQNCVVCKRKRAKLAAAGQV